MDGKFYRGLAYGLPLSFALWMVIAAIVLLV